ncbi:hypothetical protein ACFL2B_03035, partial [Patescibacteria group bacterium]
EVELRDGITRNQDGSFTVSKNIQSQVIVPQEDGWHSFEELLRGDERPLEGKSISEQAQALWQANKGKCKISVQASTNTTYCESLANCKNCAGPYLEVYKGPDGFNQVFLWCECAD